MEDYLCKGPVFVSDADDLVIRCNLYRVSFLKSQDSDCNFCALSFYSVVRFTC